MINYLYVPRPRLWRSKTLANVAPPQATGGRRRLGYAKRGGRRLVADPAGVTTSESGQNATLMAAAIESAYPSTPDMCDLRSKGLTCARTRHCAVIRLRPGASAGTRAVDPAETKWRRSITYRRHDTQPPKTGLAILPAIRPCAARRDTDRTSSRSGSLRGVRVRA